MKRERELLHSFPRFFEIDGQTFDRLELIKEHGLVSPETAKQQGIPYERRETPIMRGLEEGVYDRVIFLYGPERKKGMPIPGDTSVFVDMERVDVIEPEEMMRNHPGWVPISLGEVYALDRINPEKIRYE